MLLSLRLYLTTSTDRPFSDSDGNPVDQHSYSWAYIIDNFSKDEEISKAVISYIFDKVNHISGACLALAFAKHETSGNDVIHIAHQEARSLMYEYIFFCGCYELHPGPPVHRSATASRNFRVGSRRYEGVRGIVPRYTRDQQDSE